MSMSQTKQEERIMKFKSDPRLSGIYIHWVYTKLSMNGTIVAVLYGEYRQIGEAKFKKNGSVRLYEQGYLMFALKPEHEYYFNKLIEEIREIKKKIDKPFVKQKNKCKIAYKKYFPNLAEEQSWRAFEHYGSMFWKCICRGDINNPAIKYIAHFEMLATKRKLQLALGASPLPIPIRQAIIEG